MLHWPSGLCQCPSRWILFIVAASTARLLRARTASARPPSHLCNLSVHLHLHLPTHASVQTPAGRNPISMYEAKSDCRTATLLVWTRRSQRAARSRQPQQPAIHTSSGARHTPARASVIIAMCVGAARMYRRHRPPWHRPPWHRPPWQPCRIMSQTNPHAHMA